MNSSNLLKLLSEEEKSLKKLQRRFDLDQRCARKEPNLILRNDLLESFLTR